MPGYLAILNWLELDSKYAAQCLEVECAQRMKGQTLHGSKNYSMPNKLLYYSFSINIKGLVW